MRRVRPSLVRLAHRIEARIFGTSVPEEVDEEFAFHVEMRIRQYLAEGMTLEQAREAAERRFGEIDKVKAVCRRLGDQRERKMTWMTWWTEWAHDVRMSVRYLRKSPLMSGTAALTLALGIGATTAVFTVVNGVVLSPLPFDEPDRLVEVRTRYLPPSGFDLPRFPISVAEFVDYRDATESYEVLGIYSLGARTVVPASGDPIRVPTLFADRAALEALGVEPVVGRLFTVDEDLPGTSIGLLGHDLWTTSFGADPAIVGRTITINERPFTVTGVMPASFAMPNARYQLVENYGIDFEDLGNRASHGSYGVGRLRDGVTMDQVEAESEAIHAGWAELYEHNVAHFPIFERLEDNLVGLDVRRALTVLVGAVMLVLLVAIVNVANLLIARGEARQSEVAVRTSLGASRGRIARQLLAESLVLSCVGATLGLLVGTVGLRALLAIDPTALPRSELIGLDGRVLLFTGAVTVVAALLFGTLPALHAARSPVQGLGGTKSTASRGRRRLRQALVAGEVGLSLVVVLAAGLVVRSFQELVSVDPGVEVEERIALPLALSGERYRENASVLQYYGRVQEEVEAIPGVARAAGVSILPLSGSRARWDFLIEGRPPRNADNEMLSAQWTGVLPGYFETMGLPPSLGRSLQPSDAEGAEPVVVVSEDVVEEFFGGSSPIGERVAVAGGDLVYARIVGVVPRTRTDGLEGTVVPQIYYSVQQADVAGVPRFLWLTVQATVPVEGLAGPIRDVLRGADPQLALGEIRPMRDVLQSSVAQTKLIANLIGAFAFIALVLAVVGIYGVVSYSVSQRTGEIGIRMALGAQRRSVAGLMVREGAVPALIGLLIGIPLALVSTRLLSGLLFETSPRDPVVFVLVSASFLALALLGSWIPARRAARLAPTSALRER